MDDLLWNLPDELKKHLLTEVMDAPSVAKLWQTSKKWRIYLSFIWVTNSWGGRRISPNVTAWLDDY